MNKYPQSISEECTRKILNQMENSIYLIKGKEKELNLGFFCHIKYNNKDIPVLITSYQIINERYLSNNDKINIINNKEIIEINFGKAKYLNKELDLSVIEIKENELIKFLEIDNNLYEKEISEFCNIKDTIYILHYNNKKEKSVSYGVINNFNNFNLSYFCDMNSKSNSFPIFNLNNNQIIGLYNKASKFLNKGISFRFIINKFLREYQSPKKVNKFNINNNIEITIEVNKDNIGKDIYFLDNYDNNDHLKEFNKSNTKIYIDNEIYEFKKYFKPNKIGIHKINLIFEKNITDSSYMFAGCENIIKIDFNNFYTKCIDNMKYMFYKCSNLKYINLFNFDTSNVIDMSYMFYHCYNLIYLDLSSFNTKNVINMNNMFNYCKRLKYININSFDTSNVIDMSYMFFDCWKLNYKDISSINIKKVKNKSNYFSNRWDIEKLNINEYNYGDKNNNIIYILMDINKDDINKKINFLSDEFNSGYSDIKLNEENIDIYINKKKYNFKNYFIPKEEGEYPIIIKYNIKLKYYDNMFLKCNNIIYINFISFDSNMSCMFEKCENLININVSTFDTKNVTVMNRMFNECKNLRNLDLSSFNTKKVTDMSFMFNECNNLKYLKFSSSFDTKNASNMKAMFQCCYELNSLDISSFDTKNVTDMRLYVLSMYEFKRIRHIFF